MKLDELYLRRGALLEETKDPDFNKDISENSTRESVLSELQLINKLIAEMEYELMQGVETALPGTIGLGDIYTYTYLKVVSFGRELEIPPRSRCALTDEYNEINLFGDLGEVKKISVHSPLGGAVFKKIPGFFHVDTANGYIEVEVSE